MKKLFLLLFPLCLFSQENCFDDGQKHYQSGMGLLDIKDTLESILFNNPKHVKFEENKKIKVEFNTYFNDQFRYIQFQKEKNSLYAFAQSSFGYWLLEIKNKKPKAYYIGFSKNTYINRT